ncbi:MAG: DMT family transporter [Oscillospiraceae bacterium]
MPKDKLQGHIFAIITILFWGTTFISTKVLLLDFTPIEILFFRFVIGFLALIFVYPHMLKWTGIGRELLFMCAGITGITFYYLFENIALTMTQTANVSVIVSASPFFAAIITRLFEKEEKLRAGFFVGFIFAIFGIGLISFSGAKNISINPKGDLLALLAAAIWAIYSTLARRISRYGYSTVQTTRRTFIYGLVFMLPALFFFKFDFEPTSLAKPVNLFNIIFLGVGASALCFVTWNCAIARLGTVKTIIYLYAVPVIAIISALIILKEPISPSVVFGTALTLAGLFISQFRFRGKVRIST